MKRLHRKMTPLLKLQLITQEERLFEALMNAWTSYNWSYKPSELWSSLYSNRDNRCSTPLTIPELGVNKEGLIIES